MNFRILAASTPNWFSFYILDVNVLNTNKLIFCNMLIIRAMVNVRTVLAYKLCYLRVPIMHLY